MNVSEYEHLLVEMRGIVPSLFPEDAAADAMGEFHWQSQFVSPSRIRGAEFSHKGVCGQ